MFEWFSPGLKPFMPNKLYVQVYNGFLLLVVLQSNVKFNQPGNTVIDDNISGFWLPSNGCI